MRFQTGRLLSKHKPSWFSKFMPFDDAVLNAFVSIQYSPRQALTSSSSRQQAEKLPPTSPTSSFANKVVVVMYFSIQKLPKP